MSRPSGFKAAPAGAAALLAGLWLLAALSACGDRGAMPPVAVAAQVPLGAPISSAASADGSAMPGTFFSPAVEAKVLDLERDNDPDAACRSGLDRMDEGLSQPDDRLEAWCRAALAASPDKAGSTLAERYRRSVLGELSTTLWLQAALAGDAGAYLDLSRQLAASAGPADAGYGQLDGDTWAAAQAAAQRAVSLDVDEAVEQLKALQDREVPQLAGSKLEALWRALYFRQFDTISDTIDTRRHVIGYSLGFADVCEQWEVAIRSVGFDAALEIYAAPVRGQVPERALRAVGQVGRTLSGAYQHAREGADERSFAGWVEQGLRAFQAVKRDARNSVAVGSTVGRDAAQRLFNEVQSCRSYRGLKAVAALNDYFRFTKDRSPLDDGRSTRAQPARRRASEQE